MQEWKVMVCLKAEELENALNQMESDNWAIDSIRSTPTPQNPLTHMVIGRRNKKNESAKTKWVYEAGGE